MDFVPKAFDQHMLGFNFVKFIHTCAFTLPNFSGRLLVFGGDGRVTQHLKQTLTTYSIQTSSPVCYIFSKFCVHFQWLKGIKNYQPPIHNSFTKFIRKILYSFLILLKQDIFLLLLQLQGALLMNTWQIQADPTIPLEATTLLRELR